MENQENRDRAVKVTIYGQEYPIRSNNDADYIKKVARYVDDRIAQIEDQTSISSPMRLAILAALNIADELFTVQSEKDNILSEFEEKAREISDFLNQGLNEV